MKNSKIIIVFIMIIITSISGFFVYNHNKKVSLARYYYDIGEYQKASDLKIGEISDKARILNLAKNWRDNIEYGDNQGIYITVMLISSDINKYDKTDNDYVNKLGLYYQNIANYYNISKNKLDEIANMDFAKGTSEIENLK